MKKVKDSSDNNVELKREIIAMQDSLLSNDDVTNLRIIQNTRSNRLSSHLNNTTRRDSSSVTFKQDELVKPPK